MIRTIARAIGLVLLSFITLVLVLGVFFNYIHPDTPDPNVAYGVSFNSEYANYLGLDQKKVFTALLDDWHFHYIRLSAQWNLIEPHQGQYDFADLDWLMSEAGKRGAKVILTVGQKTPRWPECHIPTWTLAQNTEGYQASLTHYITTVVNRYQSSPALEMWQVENEPFLNFGVCPPFSEKQLADEITLVKNLDSQHPTLTSDSGELSTWSDTAHAADYFGTTIYRVVWNQYIGYMNYNLVPGIVYRAKMWLAGIDPKHMFVTELQAEPWIAGKPFLTVPLSEQYKSMNLPQLKKSVAFAATLGVPRTYLWGVEWWYWLREHGVTDIPDYIATLTKE